MKAMKRIALTVLLAFLFLCIRAQHLNRSDFTTGWRFRLDSTGTFSSSETNDASWRRLNLPHDWSIEGAFRESNPAGAGGGALPGGIGWYRKHFLLPASVQGKKVFIEFDGVYRNSEVWINGHSLGKRPNGYISFQYELTPWLRYGLQENLIAVRVDNADQPNSRWYSGSGIYRNVWLTITDSAYIRQWGTQITTPRISKDSAAVAINTSLFLPSGLQNLSLQTQVYDPSGKLVATQSVSATDSIERQELSIAAPQLWSPDSPRLYRLESRLVSGNRVYDRYRSYFGIRSFSFDTTTGFSLNGKPLRIMGVCNHHDLGALGAAVNTRALERQLQLLKDMGCNAIRTSHNPPAPELLELADRMGFLVMDEAFDMWAIAKTPYDYHLYWQPWHRRDLADQVLRDRNHPSVIVWSLGNEIMEQGAKDSSGSIISRELASLVRSLDTTRPLVTANNHVGVSNPLIRSGAFDLVGYNYNHARWDSFAHDWPGRKLIVTESTSALETRGHYDRVPVDSIRRLPQRGSLPLRGGNQEHTVSAYDQVSTPWGTTHEETLRAFLRNPRVSGIFVWTGFDYLGEPTPYSWPSRSSYFGIIDLAGFPKDVYYLYQSLFTSKTVLHLLPHWNWQKGDTVDVVAYYNNADAVELFLNGKSLGLRKKRGDTLHVSWRVPWEPGVLKAVSRKGRTEVKTTTVRTAGAPARILLKADRPTIDADGKDLAFITATLVDSLGTVVPTASNVVHFEVTGPGFLVGVDSGDPVSHESFKGKEHSALAGKVLAIVQSNGIRGTVRIVASAEGIPATTLNISTR